MGWEVASGRLLTWSLEAHLTHHCNLRCRDCCTLSPHLAPWSVPVEELGRDLAAAAAALRPALFKLTGGEPLLHADVLGCVEAARASGIAEQVSLTTNGFLLPRAPDALFAALDRITLSRYSSAPLPPASWERIEARCREHGVLLTVKAIDRFQRLDRAADGDEAETRTVYAGCWLRQRCHLVHRGRFYPCTRPPHVAERLRALGRPADPAEADGVDLHAPGLLPRLLAHLERDEPLATCRLCLGASGGFFPHAQVGPVGHP